MGRLVRQGKGMWDGSGSLLFAAIPSSSPGQVSIVAAIQGHFKAAGRLAKKHHLTIRDFCGRMKAREG
jgi:hypothetical protein